MKAIELNSRTDKNGHLKIDFPLNKKDCEVRVLILFRDESPDPDDEKIWLKAISSNPALDYLKNPDEDVYTLNDGEAFYGKE